MVRAVAGLEDRIGELPVGSPELDGVMLRIGEMQRELESIKGGLGALVPDAGSPKSGDEVAAADLERTLERGHERGALERQP